MPILTGGEALIHVMYAVQGAADASRFVAARQHLVHAEAQ